MSKCFVYVIQSGDKKNDPIKIGMSDDPDSRLSTLQTGNPVQLRQLAIIECSSRGHARNLEKTIHEMLSLSHIRGEWYKAKKQDAFKALMAFANDKDFDKATIKENVDTHRQACRRLEKRVKSQSKYIQETENAVIKHKRIAKITRSILYDLGYSHEYVHSLIEDKLNNKTD